MGGGVKAPILAAALLLAAAGPAACSHEPIDPGPVIAADELTQARLAAAATPLTGAVSDYDTLVERAAKADVVLLGEDTHGTAEHYRERARITLRLVRELGFRAVVLEADWPEAARVNAYVRGLGGDPTGEQALSGFVGFPEWTWRNAEFAAFVEELRLHNLNTPPADRVGVYGMDVYDLFGAIEGVIEELSRTRSPELAAVRARYQCFSPYRSRPEAYGAATRDPASDCRDEAAGVLEILQRRPTPADPAEREAHFTLLRQSAHVAAAEMYYRAVYSGSYAWNVRDRSMAETLQAIVDHLTSDPAVPGRVVVWAHNTHVGDARATDMPLRGEVNLGQVLKERLGARVLSIGFLTYRGRVLAAPEWGLRGQEFEVRPALPDSVAGLLQSLGRGPLLIWSDAIGPDERSALSRLERAIGVVYRPREERASHYFQADLAAQFDGVVFWEETTAVTPLSR